MPNEQKSVLQKPLAAHRLAAWLARHGEACLFWALVAAYLVPVWAFRYFPTQDGPVHVSTSLILKDHGAEGTRYHEFFDLRIEPFPNWSAQVLLAGLLFVVPPLIAEKLLVSVYIIGLAGSLRYYCGAFGPRARPCALVGLLFVYNRCLWLGFYNSELSFAFGFFVLGYWLRRLERADLITAAALAVLLVISFFTHLVGFMVTALGAGWFALTSPRHRWRNLGWFLVALVPASLLTWEYLDRTGFFRAGLAGGMWNELQMWLQGRGSWHRLKIEVAALAIEYFDHHVQGELPMGLIVGALYAVLAVATVLTRKPKDKDTTMLPWRWPAALLAVGIAALYVLARDDLGDHGSFLKSRLALLPPLLILGWFQIPAIPEVRLVLGTLVVFLLAVNLVLISERMEADNRELAEYTAGIPSAGTGKVLFVIQGLERPMRNGRPQIANPLLHASHYYCLDTGNVNLDNYQAERMYFPIQFRPGIRRGRNFFIGNNREMNVVDVILTWGTNGGAGIPPGFSSVFRQGRLAVFQKKENKLP